MNIDDEFIDRLTDLHIELGSLVGDRADIRAFVAAVATGGDLSEWEEEPAVGLIAATIRSDVERAERGEDPFAIWADIRANR